MTSTNDTKYDTLHGAAAKVASSGEEIAADVVVVEVEPSSSTMIPPDYSKPSSGTDAVATPMMLEVVAPSSLREGYELEVNVGGEVLTVIIPPGGVEQGQTFRAAVAPKSMRNRRSVPVGAWKDDLCDCCTFGCCHPVLWLACCCLPVLLSQVLYRLKLDWRGKPTSREGAEETFLIVVGIFIGYMVFVFLVVPQFSNGTPEGASVVGLLNNLANIAFGVYLMVVIIRARRFVRNKFAIPAQCCGELEDCCCAWWCKCCVVAQMARHTAEYDTYAAECCTKSGLPPHVPQVV